MTRILALALLLVSLSACGEDAGDGEAPASKGRIGFSMKNANNPFFRIIGDHLAEEAARHGYEVVIVSGDDDVQTQAGQIDDWVTRQFSAIVLNPVDSRTIGPAVRRANEASIPVFTCDLKCTDPEAKVVTHVATDNFQGGRLAGEAMVELLGDTGGEVLILDLKSAESCVLRVRGFKEVVEAHNAASPHDIVIVAELESMGDKKRGFDATKDALVSHPGLDAIFAINDPAALGAANALGDRAGEIPIIGFDGQLEGRQAIKDGKILCDPIQFPDRMGRMTMQAILAYFQGEEIPAETLIPSALYTKEDADRDPELR